MTTAGPTIAGTGGEDTSSGVVNWANPGNVTADDAAYATVTTSANNSTRLTGSNFGFAIPSDATILGIVVEAKVKTASGSAGMIARINKTISNGATASAAKTFSVGTSEAWVPTGGASDLWGLALSASEVNASTFGALIQTNLNPTDTFSANAIRVTVYYAKASPDESQAWPPAVEMVTRRARRLAADSSRLMRSASMAAEFLPFSTLATDRELQWAMGGRVDTDRELQWRMGGTVSQERTLQWRVAPSPLRVHYALTGRSGPVSYTFRFERRTIANQYLQDVTPAILGGTIEANNDRDVFRTATFTIDASAVDDRGNAVTIDPLADHIAVYMDLLVDGSYTLGLPMGLFALNVPRKRFEPGGETWEVSASDNGIHLMEATTTASYTVAASANYVTGANAVKAILDDLGLSHALPNTALTLPVARTWPAGTPWLRIVNDLLHAAGMYSLWFDASGIARTRAYDDLSTRTPDVTYTGDDFVLIPITEESETTRLANQVVAVVDDPSRAVLTSVKTNADPDSPISTVTLGRTITRVIQSDAADQTTLDAIAENYLRNEAGLYRRGTLLTSIDPRRDAREVYELTVDGVYAAERWWARNWRVQLTIGAQQQHTLGKVERVAAS